MILTHKHTWTHKHENKQTGRNTYTNKQAHTHTTHTKTHIQTCRDINRQTDTQHTEYVEQLANCYAI